MYDAHGNTATLADQTLGYDVADQHVSTVVAGGPTIAYLRDVADTVVQRTSSTDTDPSVRYTAGAVLSGSTGAILQRTLSLPGGVSVTINGSVIQWSYPDLHGDSIVLVDGTGLRIGTRASYDPFGQPVDPATGDIGTTVADDAVADTTSGGADHAWAGGAGKLYEHQGSVATVEMGHASMSQPWTGSSRSTPSRVVSPTPTTTPPTPSIKPISQGRLQPMLPRR